MINKTVSRTLKKKKQQIKYKQLMKNKKLTF